MNPNRNDSSTSQSNPPRHRTASLQGRDVCGLVLLGIMAAAGCTFINSFDDLKAHVPDTGVIDSGTISETGTDTNVDKDTNPGVDTNKVDPTVHGLIVVGGETPSDGGVTQQLSVLNPTTGGEFTGFTREEKTIVNVLYDGARDVWYIFENMDSKDRVQPAPGDKIKMYVRAWDYDAGKWKPDLAAIDVPTPFTRDAMAVLNQVVVYVAFNGSSASSLVRIKTADPAAPTVIGPPAGTPLTGSFPLGVVGSRRSGGDGGNISLLRYGTCSTDAGVDSKCPLELLHILIPGSFGDPVIDATAKVIANIPDNTNGAPSFGTGTDGITGVLVATPRTDLDKNGTLFTYDPVTPGAPTSTDHFDMTPSGTTTFKFLRSLAVDECDEGVVFIPELLNREIYAIPIKAPAKAIAQKADNPAQRVTWEPYTKTMLLPFKQGSGADITAFKLTVGADKTLTFDKRGDWSIPTDLRPNIVTTKAPTKAGSGSDPCALK